ncbi:MAG: hypothetical protein U9R79_01270, partial [Armatimonadota bacterium]|nr:hypothetical protein [Armatimonadota bacterium]
MRSQTTRRLIIVGLSVCLASAAFPAEGWRIAIGGGRITGIVGTLAKYGLPRAYLTDEELADHQVLADFKVVIVTAPVSNAGAVSQAVADFVADGGYALTESHVIPPESVIAGERRGPKRSPNIIFRDVDHAIARAMRGTGAITAQGHHAMAITPADAHAATVLAYFTDDGVPDKYRGELTGGRTDLPAMILIKHGTGQWLYSGAPIAFPLALRAPQLQPAILAALEHFSQGALVPRFVALRESFSFELPSSHEGERLLPQIRWSPKVEEQTARPAPREETPEDLPEGFEALELPEDAPEDVALVGTLPAGGSAKVMLPWFNTRWYRILRIAEGRVQLAAVADGHERRLAEAPLPATREPLEVVVRRRPHSVTVFARGSALLMAPLEPMAGSFAASGLQEAFLQPCAPVVFEDDFMRAEGGANPWQTPSGTWKLFQVEGEPEHGANPFAFHAQSDAVATALAGYWFWDDYDYSVAVRPQAQSVSLLAHWWDEKDYLELRLRLPEKGHASLELIRMQPAGERVLASSPVEAARDRWHQLRLRVSRGRALCDLNGREVLRVANEALRGRGMVGLRLRGGSAFFDDARVGPWEALPLPLDGDGAWRVERGRLKPLRDGIALQPTGSACVVASMRPLTNVHASAAMRLGQARQASLLLRYHSPRDYFQVGLARRDGLRLVLARVADGRRTVLAERALGGGPGEWRELSATMEGGRVRVRVDGQEALRAADDAVAPGQLALACEGGEAAFRDVSAWCADHERSRADPPTLPYVGIIDAHTWAGAGSGWQPRPEDLDLFWHRGLYVDDVEIRLGVHRTDHGAA